MLVSQAEFARLKKVSRKTVSEWKSEGRIVMLDGKVDVEASQEKLLRDSGHRAKGRRSAVTETGVRSTEVTRAKYADGSDYGNCRNLPSVVTDISLAIEGGASDLAFILIHHMPIDNARAVVATWVREQLAGWVGGKELPDAIADDCWPSPPIGFLRWSDHPEFTGLGVTEAEWEEAAAEAGAGLCR